MEKYSNCIVRETKEVEASTPYIVSGDIKLLLGLWAKKRGFTLPNEDFFYKLRSNFDGVMKGIFPGYEFVTEKEISNGLFDLQARTQYFPVSLDRVYLQSPFGLDITRLVDVNGNDKGLGRRPATPLLLQQFRELRDSGKKQITLIDDVIFTGDLLERLCNTLQKIGIEVPTIIAGIGINKGVKKLQRLGKEVQCVRLYNTVIDEICERDFYPGVPFSGRSIPNSENVGVPYILPFGKPSQWASIPEERQASFSQFCIEQTIKLFAAIEEESERQISCSDLERKVIDLPQDNTRYVNVLREIIA